MSDNHNTFYPDYAIHPGETLKEKLKELNMSSKEFAIRTGKPEKTISEILKEKSSITPEMAVQFEKVIDIPARFWIQRQADYNETVARINQRVNIEEALDWARLFPYQSMAKLKWVLPTHKIEEKAEALLSHFKISKASSWEKIYLNEELSVAFRVSLKHEKNPYALSAWLAQGQKFANQMSAPDYNKRKLEKCMPLLKDIMVTNPDGFYKEIQNVCIEAGVKVVFTPLLPKTVISGSARWVGNNPLIQISDRYKRYDILWFTLFHEIGHLLLHGKKKKVFIEDFSKIDNEDDHEIEANSFAVRWTLMDEEYKIIIDELNKNVERDFIKIINLYSEKFNTHRDIIIGRLLRRNPDLYKNTNLKSLINSIYFTAEN